MKFEITENHPLKGYKVLNIKRYTPDEQRIFCAKMVCLYRHCILGDGTIDINSAIISISYHQIKTFIATL